MDLALLPLGLVPNHSDRDANNIELSIRNPVGAIPPQTRIDLTNAELNANDVARAMK